MRQKGFTLIELMVAISIMAVLGTMGIAGFINYNQAQVLQTSTNEVATMLNLAKSRAQSQIKIGTNCSDKIKNLDSYEVQIATNSYSLIIHCSNGPSSFSDVIYNKNLPSGLNFENSYSFFFPVQKGGVSAQGKISIINTDKSSRKIIDVNSLGGVSVQ